MYDRLATVQRPMAAGCVEVAGATVAVIPTTTSSKSTPANVICVLALPAAVAASHAASNARAADSLVNATSTYTLPLHRMVALAGSA